MYSDLLEVECVEKPRFLVANPRDKELVSKQFCRLLGWSAHRGEDEQFTHRMRLGLCNHILSISIRRLSNPSIPCNAFQLCLPPIVDIHTQSPGFRFNESTLDTTRLFRTSTRLSPVFALLS